MCFYIIIINWYASAVPTSLSAFSAADWPDTVKQIKQV